MNIVITGAGRGTGFELVKRYAMDSENRIAAISKDPGHLNSLIRVCRQINPDCEILPLVCDFNDLSQVVAGLVKKLTEFMSNVDILVNNAGVLANRSFDDFDQETARQIFEVNFFAPALLIRSLLPIMGRTGKSHIVNISSMGGFQGSVKFTGLSYYSASKAAIACLTECLAEEFKDRNIAVNCIAPGSVRTDMLKEAFPGLKARLGPEEMAEFIADFSLTGNNYMNGKIIPVSFSNP